MQPVKILKKPGLRCLRIGTADTFMELGLDIHRDGFQFYGIIISIPKIDVYEVYTYTRE